MIGRWTPTLGAVYRGNGQCRFRVWAPQSRDCALRLLDGPEVPMHRGPAGYFDLEVDDVRPGARYYYRIDGKIDRPDPCSRHQPEGVHGPSAVVDPEFAWSAAHWCGMPVSKYVIYEFHVGAFTHAGTFDGAIAELDRLCDLGVTAMELMPVAQFPGARNWGYDGVNLFAPHADYGGPDGLRRFVDACHARGMAVILDVVYNHLGPEGNYLRDFAPYFTDRYHTPWGEALNFDGPDSDDVRRFFIENALYWVGEMRIDALRLDAVHAIVDASARPFIAELAAAVHALGERLGRRIHVIAESDADDPRLVRGEDLGGCGLDAVWNDDFHHALHARLTGESSGYYADFGDMRRVAKTYREAFVHTGGYSRFRRRRHGAPCADVPAARFVVFAQNHDQVGNRMKGDRLPSLVSFEQLKLAAGAVILSPYIPLLFMGEEYAEPAPFQYFISHGDPALVETVRRGRAAEFRGFGWHADPPDPQSEETFLRSKLETRLRREGRHAVLHAVYAELLRLRRDDPVLATPDKTRLAVSWNHAGALHMHRWYGQDHVRLFFNFSREETGFVLAPLTGEWTKQFDSASARWEGPGETMPPRVASDAAPEVTIAPNSFAVYTATASHLYYEPESSEP